MAAISKPVIVLGIAGLVLAYVLAQQEDRPYQKSKPKAKASKSAKTDESLTAEDFSVSFTKPVWKSKNLFMPLVAKTQTIEIPSLDGAEGKDDDDKIPPDLCGGESGWIFTGFAQVNGESMALLENPGSHQGGFVKKGEPWKSTRILRITPQSVVFADKAGQLVVLRHDPSKASKNGSTGTEPGGIKPVDPGAALKGPIGGPAGGPPGSQPPPGGIPVPRPSPGGIVGEPVRIVVGG